MADKTTAYQVGRGKPPVHSQFKKGQSGNPSGKPGPVKSMQTRLKLALNSALGEHSLNLRHYSYQDTSLDEVVKRMVVSAAGGDKVSTRLLLALMEKLDKAPHIEPTESEDPEKQVANETPDDKSGTSSLPQGKTQGRIASEASTNGESVAEQAVDRKVASPAGKPDDAAAAPEAAARPKRPTIMVAGRIVQQGD